MTGVFVGVALTLTAVVIAARLIHRDVLHKHARTVHRTTRSIRQPSRQPPPKGPAMSTALEPILDTVKEYQEINAEIAEKRERLATLRARIEDALGDDDTGTILGVPVVTIKHGKRTALDQKALKAAHPEIVASFMVTSPTTTFKVV